MREKENSLPKVLEMLDKINNWDWLREEFKNVNV